MKFPEFDYARPSSVDEALKLLSDHGETATLLAGGQSLMPILAFRLAQPGILVDLKSVPGLNAIRIDDAGVALGATVRWCDILGHSDLGAYHPLLVEAVSHVAHYQIRNRGTVGGSLAYADPAAELPGIAVTCDATIVLAGTNGRREVGAGDFFVGALTTAIQPGEIIVEVRFPKWPGSRRWAFLEFARRRGDFALAGTAVFFDTDGDGAATNTHIGVIGAGDRARRLGAAEEVVNGRKVDQAVIDAAGAAAAADVDPLDDFHAPAEYRRDLVKTLVWRALAKAAAN